MKGLLIWQMPFLDCICMVPCEHKLVSILVLTHRHTLQLGSPGLNLGVARVDVAHAQSRSRDTIPTLDRWLPVL